HTGRVGSADPGRTPARIPGACGSHRARRPSVGHHGRRAGDTGQQRCRLHRPFGAESRALSDARHRARAGHRCAGGDRGAGAGGSPGHAGAARPDHRGERGLVRPHHGQRERGRTREHRAPALGEYGGHRRRHPAALPGASGAAARGCALEQLLRPGTVRVRLGQWYPGRDHHWRGTRGARAAALPAQLAIPATVALVGLALGITGQTINLMTLAGIAAALGLIADDTIVVIENIESHHSRGDVADPTEHGAAELRPALVGSSLSTIVILLPFALLSGVVGAFFKPLALTMALALIISLGVAMVAVPVAVSFLHRTPQRRPRPTRHADDLEDAGNAAGGIAGAWLGLQRWSGRLAQSVRRVGGAIGQPLRDGYAGTVRLFVRRGLLSVVLAAALVGIAWLLYSRIGSDFLPDMDEGSIILDYWSPPGTSLSETDAMLREAERVIMSLPDVASYSRRTGTQLGFFITEPNRGDYVIKLKPRAQRRGVDDV